MTLSYDPWAELIDQSGCELQEAEIFRPLDTLQSVWAALILNGKVPDVAILKSPLKKSDPIQEAIAFLLAQKLGVFTPPLSVSIPTLSIAEMCQLSILRWLSGSDGEKIARQILHFVNFPTLWSREGSYKDKEALWSISLLLRCFGTWVPIPENPDPYFICLAKLAPRWNRLLSEFASETPSSRLSQEDFEDKRAILFKGEEIQAAFATMGEGIALGALSAFGLEFPALGPQAYPLNDPSRFGIRRVLREKRWGAVFAKPDVWFDMDPSLQGGIFQSRFIGLTPEFPMAFVFYVKAEKAQVGNEIFYPKSLLRYSGGSRKIVFERNESRVTIESGIPGKMDLIPLAGEGCFWNAEFLLAFEIPSFDGRVSVKFSS